MLYFSFHQGLKITVMEKIFAKTIIALMVLCINKKCTSVALLTSNVPQMYDFLLSLLLNKNQNLIAIF